MKIRIALFFMAIAGVFHAAAQTTEPKTALLIANGNYRTLGNLEQPIPEAYQLKASLEGLGFEVTVKENASLEQMIDALIELQATLNRKGGIGFFHYGGHAVQVGGRNYLIPATADIPDEARVASRAVSLDDVNAYIGDSDATTSIVILDACRDNPLPRQSGRSASRGLSITGQAPQGVIVVYSAQAGATAQDGVFTPALIKLLNQPKSFNEVLQDVAQEVSRRTNGAQRPFSYADLTIAPLYLAGRTPLAPPIDPVAPPPVTVPETRTPVSATVNTGRLAQVQLQREKLNIEYNQAVEVRKGTGWVPVVAGGGGAAFTLAGVGLFLWSEAAYSDYQKALDTASADGSRELVQQLDTWKVVSLVAGAAGLATWLGYEALTPKPDKLQESINQLDQEIRTLGGTTP